MSHKKKTGWLGFIGDYTIQLYGDYNKLLQVEPGKPGAEVSKKKNYNKLL